MRPSFGKECLLSILFELCFALLIAAVTPLLIRFCLLPTSVHLQYPLNIVFHTCDHDLHSVCSFPSATLEYEKNSLFSPNVAYYLSVRLKFADIASSNKLGLFQNVITITDENKNVLKQYTKSAYVKELGLITKASQVFLFPLYVLGFFYDYSYLNIPMSVDYLETNESPSTKLVFTVQDKFANIEEAELIVTARFGLIRHVLYYWPASSYAFLFGCFFAFGVFMIISKIGYLEYSARSKAALEKDKDAILKRKDQNLNEAPEVSKEIKSELKVESTEIRKRK
uniref:Seipin n=1 Tax=Caenorhabditis tropicalis TaxID=1561998 RepID=A0A1I7T3J0_9PELO